MRLFNSLLTLVSILVLSFSINAQEISVKSGFFKLKYFQGDEQIMKKEFKDILATNTGAFDLWNKGKRQENLWWTFAGLEAGFGVWFFTVEREVENQRAPLIGIVGSFAIGSIFYWKSVNSKKKAISIYNKQFEKKATFQLFPVSNRNGLGLALKF